MMKGDNISAREFCSHVPENTFQINPYYISEPLPLTNQLIFLRDTSILRFNLFKEIERIDIFEVFRKNICQKTLPILCKNQEI